jgi:glycosyltransferase involved in cell wall biosynthesis
MKVCIVTSKHVSYNPRVVKEADALTAAGHDVTVVTVCNNREQSRLDTVVMATRNWRLATVAYRREGAIESFRWLRFGLRQRFHSRYFSRLTHRFGVAERAQGREYPELRRLACSVRADLYIAHHVEALGVASAAARKHSARFAFDAEDFHSGMFAAPATPPGAGSLGEEIRNLLEQAEQQSKGAEHRRIEYLERNYLPQCAYITAASDGIAEAYALKYNLLRPTTILNVFPLEDRFKIASFEFKESADTNHDSRFTIHESRLSSPFTIHHSHPYRLYWYSQVIGPGRGLEDAVKALALVKSPCELHLRGTSLEPFVTELIDLATLLGVRERLFIHPPCQPDDLITEAARYDIGLALENTVELNRLICVTNKIFTYMNAGLAIVASDTPGQRGIMAQVPDVGLVCRMNDAESLSEVVNHLISQPERLYKTKRAARMAAEKQFNWGKESLRLLTVIQQKESGYGKKSH